MKQEQENQKQQFGTGLCRHLFQEEVNESGLRIRCVPVKGGVIRVSDHELNRKRRMSIACRHMYIACRW